jgi:DNA-binding MarR family transcriptional regulator
MTNRVDRLVERDLVKRLPDPYDGRGVIVRLTAEGRRVVDLALADLLERERTLLAGLPANRQRELAQLLRQLALRFDDMR